jgi:hypothetical protein
MESKSQTRAADAGTVRPGTSPAQQAGLRPPMHADHDGSYLALAMEVTMVRISKCLMPKRIVTECRGSWKWQDAYRVARYQMMRAQDGRLLWESVGRGPKYSLPQLSARGISLDHGSLHHQAVDRWDLLQLAEKAGMTARQIHRYDALASRMVRGWPALSIPADLR